MVEAHPATPRWVSLDVDLLATGTSALVAPLAAELDAELAGSVGVLDVVVEDDWGQALDLIEDHCHGARKGPAHRVLDSKTAPFFKLGLVTVAVGLRYPGLMLKWTFATGLWGDLSAAAPLAARRRVL